MQFPILFLFWGWGGVFFYFGFFFGKGVVVCMVSLTDISPWVYFKSISKCGRVPSIK